MQEMTEEVASRTGLTPAGAQAVLWFFEQGLYRDLGTNTRSETFSDGAREFLRRHGPGRRDNPAADQAQRGGQRRASAADIEDPLPEGGGTHPQGVVPRPEVLDALRDRLGVPLDDVTLVERVDGDTFQVRKGWKTVEEATRDKEQPAAGRKAVYLPEHDVGFIWEPSPEAQRRRQVQLDEEDRKRRQEATVAATAARLQEEQKRRRLDAIRNAPEKVAVDPEGRSIRAKFIAGIEDPSGNPQALSPDEIEVLAEALATSVIRQEGGGDGATGRFDYGVGRLSMFVPEDTAQYRSTLAHETGHAVDWRLKEPRLAAPTGALVRASQMQRGWLWSEDAARLYFGGNTAELEAYRRDPRELFADAVALYLRAPAVMKSEFPVLAKWLREQVNGDPQVSRTLALLSAPAATMAAAALAGALTGGGDEEDEPMPLPGA